MRLPTRPAERLGLYRELLHRCAVSRGDRRERYRRYKVWYLTGSDSGGLDSERVGAGGAGIGAAAAASAMMSPARRVAS